MKQLDEMERMDLDDVEFQSARIAEAGYPLHDQEAVYLARALLAVMPTIRAALEWRDANPGSPKWAAKSWRLRESIDDLRRRLGGE